jgi:hypothetical protein
MLAHPAYADLVHAIGVASLGADDKMIWWVAGSRTGFELL